MVTNLQEEKFWIHSSKTVLKIHLASHPAHAKGFINTQTHTHTHIYIYFFKPVLIQCL